jgi:hypothetical protein
MPELQRRLSIDLYFKDYKKGMQVNKKRKMTTITPREGKVQGGGGGGG